MLIYNGIIHTMEQGKIIHHGYLILEEGKIKEIGEKVQWTREELDKYTESYDAEGKFIFPGFIDSHCHLGLFGDALGFEGDDGNESTDPCTPHLRAIDGINPFDRGFEEARMGGVTTVVTGPGSANPISGQFVAIKTAGKWIDTMVIQAPIAMKLALGENPKCTYHDRDESPITRMGIMGIIRENLTLAQEYLDKIQIAEEDEEEDRPDFDAKLEALVPVLKKEIPVHIHCHRADDILSGVRIAKEFDLDYVLVHCTEGHLVGDILGDLGASVITGPSFGNRSKPELKNLSIETSVKLQEAGAKVAICTDHPETPIQYLPLCASLAVKAGMSMERAMEAITINPAEILGLSHRIGSLAVGKDGDVVILDKHPLEFYSKICCVFIDGVQVS